MKKRLFKPELPDRVSHDEYRQTVKVRGRADRALGWFLVASGSLSLIGVTLGLILFPEGILTGHKFGDKIVLAFIGATSIYFVNRSLYMIKTFQCRFCLAEIPEGSTYCPNCKADLLSNENPQDLGG